MYAHILPHIRLHIRPLLRNSLWLSLALACAFPLAGLLTGGDPGASPRGAAVLAAAVLLGGTVVDALDHDHQGLSLRASLLAVLAASSLLLIVALSRALRVPPADFVLQVLTLFTLFRCLSAAVSAISRPAWLSERVMLLGNGAPAETVRALIQTSEGRYILTRHLPESADLDRSGQDRDALASLAIKDGADTLVVSFPDRRGAMPLPKLLRCRMRGLAILDVPSFYEKATRKLYLENTTPAWFIFAPGFRHSLPRRACKRLFDVLGSLVGLILLLPLLPCLALAIRLDSPGPALFRQVRTGRGGRPFTLFKFRTMRQDAEAGTGAVWAATGDPRITRLGRFLRQSRLDETPQLLNVLLGHMSLVGPRPERPEFIRDLERDIPFYAERHCVKPGVTGWAQVRYPYGASVADSLEKLRYDLYYIKNQSFWLDLEIVCRTVVVVLLRCGAR